MNSSSKTPPRFVPTLTEVVPESVDSDISAPGEAVAQAQTSPSTLAGVDEAPVPEQQPPLHSPRLAAGMPAARGFAAIPRHLPPLPDSLPPQQFLSGAALQAVEQSAPGEAPEHGFEGAGRELAKVEGETSAPEAQAPAMESAEPAADAASDEARVSPVPQLSSQALAPVESAARHSVPNARDVEERLMQRLMSHVGQLLETRLSEAISAVVQQQAQSMALKLREEVESVVRQSVRDAVEQELPQDRAERPDPDGAAQ
ncbi:hypothetical protein GCM10010975_11300 [Comamonas phosphati]|nr:hypothetical protein GCM10010975_11300 [Comamonas phosphati]